MNNNSWPDRFAHFLKTAEKKGKEDKVLKILVI